jgi:hypothetical protein
VNFNFHTLTAVEDTELFARTVDFDMTPLNPTDRFGAVTAGSLVLMGNGLRPSKKLRYAVEDQEWLVVLPGQVDMRLNFHLDDPSSTLASRVKVEDKPVVHGENKSPTSLNVRWPDELHLVPLFIQRPKGVCGLVLLETSDDIFQRVGLFEETRFMHHHTALFRTGDPGSCPHRGADEVAQGIAGIAEREYTII